jgi:uncharacterized membrane protein YdbT with pleckstrin-like domain
VGGRHEIELEPNVMSGAAQLIFDNYVVDRDFMKKNLPHELLVYGILGIGLIGYYAIGFYTSYRLPIYSLAVLPVIGFVIQIYFLRGELKGRKYLIDESSVEIQDDFLDKESKSARFENVTDIKLEKPFVQRVFGTGNIKLSTAGKGTESELALRYLDNPDQYYQELSDLVNSREYNQDLH